MEKFFGTSEEGDKIVGKEKEKYTQSDNPDTVRVMFKGRRTFELHIGRKVYRFEGRESKYLPKSDIDHKDFTDQIKQYFVIGE